MNINEIVSLVFRVIVIIFSVIGGISCIFYICENILFKKCDDILTKHHSYLIINVNDLGEQLEFYIRNLQNELENDRILNIKKIILYVKPDINTTDTEYSLKIKEYIHICELLSVDYNNISFTNNTDFVNLFE